MIRTCRRWHRQQLQIGSVALAKHCLHFRFLLPISLCCRHECGLRLQRRKTTRVMAALSQGSPPPPPTPPTPPVMWLCSKLAERKRHAYPAACHLWDCEGVQTSLSPSVHASQLTPADVEGDSTGANTDIPLQGLGLEASAGRCIEQACQA